MQIVTDSQGFQLVAFEAERTGPTVCVVGGVHGDETCGLNTITLLQQQLLTGMKLMRGRLLTLIANLAALNLNQRCVDFDLNRCFRNTSAYGHESQLARYLMAHLDGIDYLLDLHSTSAPTRPFCAGASTNLHLIFFEMIGFEVYTKGWEIHRQHTMLINEVDRLGGIGIIAECGRTGEAQTDETAYCAVLRLLQALEMLSAIEFPAPRSRLLVRIEKIITAKTEDFHFTRHFENLDLVKANEVVAYDGRCPISYAEPFHMTMPTRGRLQIGEEAFGIDIVETFN